MKYCRLILSWITVGGHTALSLASGFSLGLASQPSASAQPVQIAQTRQSAACRNEQYAYSFTQWTRLQWHSTAPTSEDLPQLQAMLQRAEATPQMTQLAIDRLTDPYLVTRNPTLLRWIDQTPASQRGQWLALVDRLVGLAQSLPPGYNYAQSRAFVTAAQAYHQLGQRQRSQPLLQQTNKTLAGITLPPLQAEVQWRLAGVWFDLGQPAEGNARLAAIAPLFQANPKAGRPSNRKPSTLPLSGDSRRLWLQFIDDALQRQQLDFAAALARDVQPVTLRSEQQFRIAAAYLRRKQNQPAIALFNQALASLGNAPRQNPGQNPEPTPEAIATQGIIQFVQAGGVTTATQAARQLSQAPAQMRAQMWLAIAGEARQQKRPQETAPAIAQLIAAGRQGQQQKFNTPYGFNGFQVTGGSGWGQSLYRLSQVEGYQSEFIQLIEQLKIQAEAAEFLIAMAVEAQQFDRAQQLIPSPLVFRNEAGTFDVQASWRLWVAVAAARAGKPQQLIALGEQAMSQLKTPPVQPINFFSPPEFIRQDPPFVEVIDMAIGSQPPEYDVLVAIQVLHQQGQSAAARPLAQALADRLAVIAEQRLSSGVEVPLGRLISNEHFPLAWFGGVEQFLRLQDQPESAARLAALQITYLQQITNPELRAQEMAKQMVLNTSVPDLAAEISRFVAQAKAAGVADQPSIAQRIVEAAIVAGKPELAADWQAQAGLSLQAQAELWSTQTTIYTYSADSVTLLRSLDKALSLYQQDSATTRPLDNQRASQWIGIYLRFGKLAKARQIVELMSDSNMARQWAVRLDCLG
ncbi:hypothetical protein ACN4EG_06895 [Alkalinema pantanalense CENA528]|uniref:hypothetical protein n=1 Tax=Alkalinema pantanalense TaxID=1620705 RepID=UPI003D6FE6BF